MIISKNNIKDISINYSIRQEIMSMNKEQIDCVIQAINDRRTMLQLEERAKFSVGDSVWFESKGKKYSGKITKMNPKSIQVKVMKDDGLIDGIWNVSATYLNK